MTSQELALAAEVLRAGGLVAFPTETVYGLGADATNEVAVERIFLVKGRPPGHPLIVHLGSADQIDEWARAVPPQARLLAEVFWPGPLTLLLRRSAQVADRVTGGLPTVGLRVPGHSVALRLVQELGGGVAAPSANRFGRVSPTTAAHVIEELGDDVDHVLDGGPCQVGIESTIVDLSTGTPEVVRVGGVTAEQLEDVLGGPVPLWNRERPLAAPGTLASHYSPDASVELVVADEAAARAQALVDSGQSVGLLAPATVGSLPREVVELGPAGSPESYARNLYQLLRQADALGLDVVLAVPPPPTGLGLAVIDRLRRAAV